ncbi:MAG: protein kinase [Blastocatellia bacterium]|nr:protein kinase [Blastocatellia bacterium]
MKPMHRGDIFIVDDNSNNLAVLAGILQDGGFQVRAANNGRRALAMVELDPPELIMLDVQMPEMNGYEVCVQLKANEASQSIPVIFISALDDVLDKVRAFEVGGVDYVTKPFHGREVIARVEAQLRLFRLQRELEQKQSELEEQARTLERRNAELVAAQHRTDLVFSALSETLQGTVIDGRYRLESKIGSGGFGAVFRGTQIDLARLVAIKVFRPTPGNESPDSLERFRQEGIAACRFVHPNAVAVFDFGISSTGIAYLVMELLEGETLGRRLERESRIEPEKMAEIVEPLCEAHAEAHAAGIVHRDVKPENVFLHATRDGEVVKVLDFGIAKLFGDDVVDNARQLTDTGGLLGTPDYVAPERIMGEEFDGRADVYSVGVMMYQMLSGRLPHFGGVQGASPYAIALSHLTKEPYPLRRLVPDIPEDVEAIVMQAMSKVAAERLTAVELAAAMRRLAYGHRKSRERAR